MTTHQTALLNMANRLTAASEVLGRLAERDGRVSEIVRLRSSLEAVLDALAAGDVARATGAAEKGLGWKEG